MNRIRNTNLTSAASTSSGVGLSPSLSLAPSSSSVALGQITGAMGSTITLVPFSSGRELSREGKRIAAELQRQALIIMGQSIKTNLGVSAIASMHLHANGTFLRTTQEIITARNAARVGRSKDHQAYIDLFTQRQMEMFGSSVLTAVDLGTGNVLAAIQQTLDLEPEKRGFWNRLLGR